MVKKLADTLETTVGYLLGENQDINLLKDPAMLKRLNDISSFPDKDKEHISILLMPLSGMLKSEAFKILAGWRKPN